MGERRDARDEDERHCEHQRRSHCAQLPPASGVRPGAGRHAAPERPHGEDVLGAERCSVVGQRETAPAPRRNLPGQRQGYLGDRSVAKDAETPSAPSPPGGFRRTPRKARGTKCNLI